MVLTLSNTRNKIMERKIRGFGRRGVGRRMEEKMEETG